MKSTLHALVLSLPFFEFGQVCNSGFTYQICSKLHPCWLHYTIPFILAQVKIQLFPEGPSL